MNVKLRYELDRIEENIAESYYSAAEQGADLPDEQNSDNLAQTIGTIKSIKFTKQALSEEQKIQARQNIGAVGEADLREVVKEELEDVDNGITEEDLLSILVDMDVVRPISDITDAVYVDCDGKLYVL